jgi:hypothetical protein
MSTFKKNTLAAALVAGLGLAGVAAAFTITTDGDANPVLVATADVVSATTPIGVDEATTISLVGSDFILGRTTGFTIRITLNNGATFDASLTTADLTIGAANSTWTPTIVAGGGDGDNFVVINMDPTATPVALTTGDLLTINAATSVVAPTADVGLVLDSLTALQTEGATVSATVQFVDPVTAAAIMPAQSVTLLRSGDPVVLACDAQDGDTQTTIDVGTSDTQAAKTFFSSTGVIGATDTGTINLGSVSAAVDTGFTSFDYLATDEFQTIVSGDFSAFSGAGAGRDVFLSVNADCSTNDVNGTINNTNGTVTFDYTGADVGIDADGFTAFVCASVPGGNTTVIDASAVSVTTTFIRGDVQSASTSCDLLPLRYNGSVVEVWNVNPAGNTTAQSFLRIINRGDSAGTVTIVGTDDAGNESSAVTFNLAAGASMQVNSDDLENGNAAKGLSGSWGDGTGKWRAVVTGEFANMVVQSMNRNSTDGTVTNLTDGDTQGEQNLNKLFEQGLF